MLDIMFGDPLLTNWEKRFIRDVAEKGWLFDYTEKQAAKIKEIFRRQKRKYSKEKLE